MSGLPSPEAGEWATIAVGFGTALSSGQPDRGKGVRMRRLATLIVLLALSAALAACADYGPPGQPYAVNYCNNPPDQSYVNSTAIPHPMQCYQCGVCY